MVSTNEPQTYGESNLIADKVTVMIVDDHQLLRDGLTLLINGERDLEVCGEARGEAEAMLKIPQLNPGVVIVDVSLEEGSGIELVKQIRQRASDARVIVCTMHDERIYGERAMRAGASGFVSKKSASRTVLTAIRQVLDGKLFFGEELIQGLVHKVVGHNGPALAYPVETLSNRELEVFTLIGQGLTTDQIANHLHLSQNTVGTHRERLKIKLRLKNGTELCRFATQWVLEGN